MAVSKLLRAKPVDVQARYSGELIPPCYDLIKADVGIALLGKLAQTYNLRSTGIVINQNASSTQYLQFRHVLPGEPLGYFDASIGVDQVEIVFSNPATVSELMNELAKVWSLIFTHSGAIIGNNHFDATLHCETGDLSTHQFLNEYVKIQLKAPAIQKGFSLTVRPSGNGTARIGLEVSESVPNGLYVLFAFVNRGVSQDIESLKNQFDGILTTYRELQSLARIELVEPE
jgi:hypothetical protein